MVVFSSSRGKSYEMCWGVENGKVNKSMNSDSGLSDPVHRESHQERTQEQEEDVKLQCVYLYV